MVCPSRRMPLLVVALDVEGVTSTLPEVADATGGNVAVAMAARMTRADAKTPDDLRGGG